MVPILFLWLTIKLPGMFLQTACLKVWCLVGFEPMIFVVLKKNDFTKSSELYLHVN